MPYDQELAAMQGWLDATDRIAMDHFRVDVPYKSKDDGTPVTEADVAIEEVLRKAIQETYPEDAVVGEEGGTAGDPKGDRRWIIDPIDGTKNFRRGIPIFATLIALEEKGSIVAGVVSAPAINCRWFARKGGGAFRDGTKISVSKVKEVALAEISSGGVGTIAQSGLEEKFAALCQQAARHRGFGDFWGHCLVAQGSMDVMLDPEVAVWDLAALKIIVEEAGGKMTSAIGEDRIDGGSALTTNGNLHDEVVRALNS
ncbi:MAG TPA: inositol monophosphatase family protein [Actinomycetota bacterium]|nr:inositol monophosphatase family protein [Actinomycetota bacterium]